MLARNYGYVERGMGFGALGVFLRLILFLLSASTCTASANESFPDPNLFFQNQPTLVHRNETDSFHLILETPLPILCAVHFGKITNDTSSANMAFDGVTTMPMAFPAEFHDVEVPVDTGDDDSIIDHFLTLTAFLPNAYSDILRSQVFRIVADPLSPSITTMGMMASADGDSNEASIVAPTECPYELSLGTVTSNSASFELSSAPPLATLHSLAFASSTDPTIIDLSRTETTTAESDPELGLSGLDSGTNYTVVGCFIDENADVCCARPIPLDFTTSAEVEDSDEPSFGEECYNENVALLDAGASVVDTSSNYGNGDMDSSFGGNKAIDGRSASAWSSFGDGNDAYIFIKLAEPVPIAGIGVWSREMVGSSQIASFSLTLSNSMGSDRCITFLGPYELPDTKSLYKFNVAEELDNGKIYDEIRLDVDTSNGGNTGLRTLEVYPMNDMCLSRSVDDEGQDSNVGGMAKKEGSDAMMVTATPNEGPTSAANGHRTLGISCAILFWVFTLHANSILG
jgi:hypothetical protein